MIGKLLEAFFRYWLLLLVPPVAIPIVVGPIAYFRAPAYYETYASAWVGATTSRDADYNVYLSPAQNQSNKLNEVMRTRAFIVEAANRTSLAPLTGSKSGQAQVHTFVSRNFALATSGQRLLTLRFRGPTAQLSYEMLTAIIATFTDRAARERTEQATTSIAFYESQVKDAESQLAKAQDALRRYVSANPRAAASDPGRSGSIIGGSQAAALAAAQDPQMADLLRRVEQDQSSVDRARKALDDVQSRSAAALVGQGIDFQLVDPPQMPTELVRERKQAIIFPIAGLMAGLGISTTLLIFFTATDRSIRFEHDLHAVDDAARVVGIIPRLSLARDAREGKKLAHLKTQKRTNPDAVRSAIGYVAGAVPEPLAAAAPAS